MRHQRCCLLSLVLAASFYVCGCSSKTEGTSGNGSSTLVDPETAKRQIAAARIQVDRVLAELDATELSEGKFRDIVGEIHQLEQRAELTDMELSDLRQAASARWSSGGYEVPPMYRELQASVEQLGGSFAEVPLSGAVLAHFKNANVSDDDLETLPGLEHVTTLVLWGVDNITDRAMDHVAERCANLRVLDIRGTNVTDAGLRKLDSIRSLRKVVLAGSRATEEGVARMSAVLLPRKDADMAARMVIVKKRQQLHRSK